jgi:hypothetical protein
MALLRQTSPITGVYVTGAAVGYEAAIDFTTKPAGAMPTSMDTGQPIVLTYNTTSAANPVISNPGSGSRYSIAATNASAQAGYVTTHLSAPVTKLAADFMRSVGIHAWRDPLTAGLLANSTEGAVCHLGGDTTGWKYAVWTSPFTIEYLRTYTYATTRSDTATQHLEVIIDPSGFALVTGDDGVQVRVPASGTDTRINRYSCSYACCEIYYNNAATDPRAGVFNFQATSAAGGATGISPVPAIGVYLGSTKVWPPPTTFTFIDSVAAATSSATMPAHLAGDRLIEAGWVGGTTLPGTPSGFTSRASNNTASPASAVFDKAATSTSDAFGTQSGAAGVLGAIYRGCTALGAIASNRGTSSTVTFPALTRTVTDGSSGILYLACHFGTSNFNTVTPPTGFTRRNGGTALFIADQLTGVTSDPTTQSIAATASNVWQAWAIELLA